MALPHHKPEWKKMPSEDAFQDWIEANGIPADQFIFPMTRDPQEMKSEAFKKKQEKCRGMLVLWDKPTNMGAAIGLTLSFFFVVAFVIAYLASLALPAGAPFSKVVQFVTTAALLTHCAGNFPHVFWFRRRISMELVDGVAYAFATGLIFAALWPGA